VEASVAQLEQQHQDNYTRLLDLYPYIATTNAQAVAPGLDTAIKKVTVVVNLHRRSDWADDCYLLAGKAQFLKKDYESAESTFRFLLNEYNPDEPKKSRPTTTAGRNAAAKERQEAAREKAEEREETAKARKKEQERARKERAKKIKQQRREREKYNRQVRSARKKGKAVPRSNAYRSPKSDTLSQQSQPTQQQIETKQAKKKQEEDEKNKAKREEERKREEELKKKKDPNYFLHRRPAYQEGVLWLAKTMIERDKYESAQRLLKQLEEDEGTFDYVRAEVPAVQAYLNLKLKNQAFAIQNLQEAVKVADKRTQKARYSYILAQLHQSLGNSEAAYTTFEDVLKYSNDYEMQFSARLNMAQNAWQSGRGSSGDAVANLEKMLKDSKNAEYRDQIYFALANIALKAGDKAKAIENLQLSLQQPSQNQSQRVETYFTLATLYYQDEDYIAAKNYFDSTLQVLPQTDARYAEVKRLSDNLTDIAKNLGIVILQDSLLKISNLSEKERNAFAAELKKRRQAEIEAAQNAQLAEASKNKAPGLAQPTSITNNPALQKPSDFPLYDEKQLRQGKRDFQRQWGDRVLEDDWRRSNKQSTSPLQNDTATTQETIAVNEEELGDLLRGVPKTESEKKIAQIKVQEALFKLGTLYRDRLQNLNKSIAALEDLNGRYPGSSSELDSWYYLYLDYKDLNDAAKAKEYADKIIDKHPYSNYAKIIQDPSYVVEVQNEEKRITDYYNEAYTAYQNGNFEEAYNRSVQSNEKFGAMNPLRAKFALLTAMSIGSTKGKDEYIGALNDVIARYPNTEEQKYAREVLRLLGATTGTLPGGEQVTTDQFEPQNDQVHSVIIALSDPSALNDAKNAVSDYHRKYHDLEKLRISDVVLVNGETRTTLIVVRRFKDKTDALRYYQGVLKNSKDFIVSTKYEIYPISQGNYGKLFSTVKSIETYKNFFEANYR
jgi:tetratricopeptide (TPR) repeat protein